MTIGIISPFNPSEFEFYFKGVTLPKIHTTATSVHALVKSFLEAGHVVWVFTINESIEYKEFHSDYLNVILVPRRSFRGTGFLHTYAVKQLRKSVAAHINELNVIHGQWTYEYSIAALSFVNRVPVFCTVRDWCPYIMSLPMPLIGKISWRIIRYGMFKKIMNNNKIHIIANSPYTYNCIKEAYPSKDVVIIPNSIKKELILANRNNTTVGIRIVSVTNGITDYRKNIVSLLRAYQKLRANNIDASLTLVGKYEEDTPILQQWRLEGLLENVDLAGAKSHDEMIAIVDQSSMMVHPSLEETFGNTLLEAMARRIPVIGGKKSGAVPYVLGNGEYGACCDITNPDDILRAIILMSDDAVANSFVNKATNYLLSNYASDVVCNKHISLYNSQL